jgi:hypothetical protein
MAEKPKPEEKPKPTTTPDKPRVEGEKKIPPNWGEKLSVQKGKKFHESKERLKNIRERVKQGKTVEKEKADAKKNLEDATKGFEMWAGDPPKTKENSVESPEVKDKKEIENAEQEALKYLREKHEAEVDDVFGALDITKVSPEDRKAIYRQAIIKAVDVSKIPESDRQKALEWLRNLDGSEINVNNLTPEQERVVWEFQAKKYITEFDKFSESDKKDTNKIKELATKRLGISDFSTQDKEGLLTEKWFQEAAKKNPDMLFWVIESVKEDGILVSGINPDSELWKKLTQISQINLDEFKKIYPEENDIKKLADVLWGTYLDVLAWAKMDWLEKFQESIKLARESLKSGELWWVVREDYSSDKEYTEALNKAAKDATGMDYKKLAKTVNTVRGTGKLSPFVKFLADLLAPIWALMWGEAWEFWRNYLKQGNGWNEVAGWGFDGGWQKFEKMKNTSPDAFLKSASKYLWWPYKYGADGSSKEKWIDCSQLVVNSLIDEGCLPKWYDTTAMGFAQRSHRVGDDQGKKWDFLIMGEPSPHIAIIAEDPAPGSKTYKTIEAASGKWGVVYTQRTAGNSFKVYKNPFFEGANLAQNKEWKETFNIMGTPVTITPPLNPKNLSDRNKNPLNIKSSKFPWDVKWHSICPSYEAGITIAVEDLQKKLNGQSDAVRRYTGWRNATYVRDVIGTWAPESDGNNPNEYTRTVLSRMGFSWDLLKIPVSAVKDRIPELVLQMAKVEWCQASFEFWGGH